MISIRLASEPGYTFYHLRECSGRNELFLGTVENRAACRTKCDNNNKCVSFEWWGELNSHPNEGSNYCQISSSCTYDRSVESNSNTYATDLYVKGN